MATVQQCFTECQQIGSSHKILSLQLKTEHLKLINSPSNNFTDEFCRCLDHVLQTAKRDQSAQRIVSFVAEYVQNIIPQEDDDESEDDEQMIEFAEAVIQRYLKGFAAKQAVVRQKCLDIVNQLMPLVPLVEELLDEIRDLSLVRIRDSDARVRLTALNILSRFEPSAEIVEPLMLTVKHDPSSDMRLMAAYNISKAGKQCLEVVCTRSEDSSVSVRRAVFAKLLPFVKYHKLKQVSRELVARSGLTDPDQEVRKHAEQLVSFSWVDHCGSNIARVIRGLDAVRNTKASELVLNAFFKLRSDVFPNLKFDQSFFNDLLPEDCCVLKEAVLYANEHPSLDYLIPDVDQIIAKISSLYQNLDAETEDNSMDLDEDEEDEDIVHATKKEEQLFMVEMLLQVISLSDLTDLVVRSRVQSCISDIELQYLPTTAIKHIVAIYKKLDYTDRSIVLQVFELQEGSDAIVDLIRGLTLLNHLLPTTNMDIEPLFDSIKEQYIQPALDAPRKDFINLGIECLGNASLLSKKIASEEFPTLLVYAQNNEQCLKVVVDVLLTHPFLQIPEDFVNNELKSGKDYATTQLARLALAGLVYSLETLHYLVLKYFKSPNIHLQQTLGLFLYAFKKSKFAPDLVEIFPAVAAEIPKSGFKQFVAQYTEFIDQPGDDYLACIMAELNKDHVLLTKRSLMTTLMTVYPKERLTNAPECVRGMLD